MFSVPFFTSTVATAPRPFSTLDSMTMPEARPSRGARSSRISACSRIESSRLSMPAPVRAETLHEDRLAAPLLRNHIVLGQLGANPIRIGSGLSILLTATTIGTPAARAC